MATNLALQLQVIEPDTDLNSIMIGNFRYSDDVWDLSPFITAKTTKESQKYIRFEYISDADMIKRILKNDRFFAKMNAILTSCKDISLFLDHDDILEFILSDSQNFEYLTLSYRYNHHCIYYFVYSN